MTPTPPSIPTRRRRLPRPTPAFLATAALLVAGLVPLPRDSWARRVRQSARAMEPNRAERRATEAGYYEGLINVGAGGDRDELALRLLGMPRAWVNFHDIGATRYLTGDLLQFELMPGLRATAFGRPFVTNAHGMRDRDTAAAKPPGTVRIALLGSSMDMGWGVATDETYENRLEDWLNRHARRLGLARQFEVLNFSMAAYSPVQRLEAYRRKAAAFRPDAVLFAVTMLDERLTQIHLRGLLQDRVDPASRGYDFLAQALASCGLAPDDLQRDAQGRLLHKEAIKAKLAAQFWPITDGTLAALAADCRSAGIPAYCVIIPRAGESDPPAERAPTVARYRAAAARGGLPVLDLTATFDGLDPVDVSVAPWDDHPNARGHTLLFRALAQALVADRPLYRALFGRDPAPPAPPAGGRPGDGPPPG